MGQQLETGILLAEPQRLEVENALEMVEDKFKEDSVIYTTEWDSDNENAVSPVSLCRKGCFLIHILGHQELEARLAKWFRCNDAKWADLMCRIQSSELGAAMVPASPKQTKVAREEIVEKYDDDFDVDCDLACMKVRATLHSNWRSKSITPALSRRWW